MAEAPVIAAPHTYTTITDKIAGIRRKRIPIVTFVYRQKIGEAAQAARR